MDNLISKAKELLANGDIDLFIGYEKGTVCLALFLSHP